MGNIQITSKMTRSECEKKLVAMMKKKSWLLTQMLRLINKPGKFHSTDVQHFLYVADLCRQCSHDILIMQTALNDPKYPFT